MQLQSDICVIGNGAVGKATALGFAQAGLKVTLLAPDAGAPTAQKDEASWDVRVFALNQGAQRLLSRLKVWDALDGARVAPVESMIVNGDGERAGKLAFDAYGARAASLAWILEERNLATALDSALRFAPGLRTVSGHAVALRQESGAATVVLDNGDSITSALLVGADGAQSWVRGQCDIGIDYRSYGQRAIVANFECEQAHRGAAYQWFSASEGIIALLPLPGNRMSLVWSAPDALADTLLRGSLDELAARLSRLPGLEVGQLTPLQPECVKAFPLRLLRTHAIVAPHVALVGDAAHVVHPLAGHGMNLGFADVADLLDVVTTRESQRSCGDERVLGRYARRRREDILLMQVATDGLERLFSTEFEPLRIARNIGLNLVDKLPVIKRKLIGHAMGR